MSFDSAALPITCSAVEFQGTRIQHKVHSCIQITVFIMPHELNK